MTEHSAWTISQFCARQSFSRGYFYKIKKLGLGPREMNVNGLIRITVEAEAEWKAEREAATAQTVAA